jgi:hypothetical protein
LRAGRNVAAAMPSTRRLGTTLVEGEPGAEASVGFGVAQ